MELVQWRPVSQELSSFRKEMDRLWNSFFGDTPVIQTSAEHWLPLMDFSEIENTFVVKTELPGVEISDVNVSICGDLLTIKGQKKKQDQGGDEFCYSTERYYGPFKRIFQLPTSVEVDEVKASFDKGVLKVVLPKAGEVANKEVDIEVT